MTRVLGIDLASSDWAAIGTALIAFEGDRFTRVTAPAIRWPTTELTPSVLADAIDAFARREAVRAIALDGPQGWRDPNRADSYKGRQCEKECATQGKTGVHPQTYPKKQSSWIQFSIAVFDELVSRPSIILANETDLQLPSDPAGYLD